MKLQTTKMITRVIVGFGATSITNQIVRNNVVPGSLFQKITITAAMIAAGAMLGEKLGTYTDDKIDEIVELVEDSKNVTPLPV